MKIYNYDSTTFEYNGTSVADESPLEPRVFLIPALATEIQPPISAENEAVIFDANKNQWSIVSDYRNVDLWSKNTGEQVAATLGERPEDINATQIEPTVDYPSWDVKSGKWVTDETAKLSAQTAEATSKVQQLLSIANDKISPLQDAAELGIATDAETTSLTKWKTFRVLVNRVTSQVGYPVNIDWPPMPE